MRASSSPVGARKVSTRHVGKGIGEGDEHGVDRVLRHRGVEADRRPRAAGLPPRCCPPNAGPARLPRKRRGAGRAGRTRCETSVHLAISRPRRNAVARAKPRPVTLGPTHGGTMAMERRPSGPMAPVACPGPFRHEPPRAPGPGMDRRHGRFGGGRALRHAPYPTPTGLTADSRHRSAPPSREPGQTASLAVDETAVGPRPRPPETTGAARWPD